MVRRAVDEEMLPLRRPGPPFPAMTGDHSRDLEALTEYMRSGVFDGEGQTPLLSRVVIAAIEILAGFQRKQAELELELTTHDHDYDPWTGAVKP